MKCDWWYDWKGSDQVLCCYLCILYLILRCLGGGKVYRSGFVLYHRIFSYCLFHERKEKKHLLLDFFFFFKKPSSIDQII